METNSGILGIEGLGASNLNPLSSSFERRQLYLLRSYSLKGKMSLASKNTQWRVLMKNIGDDLKTSDVEAVIYLEDLPSKNVSLQNCAV